MCSRTDKTHVYTVYKQTHTLITILRHHYRGAVKMEYERYRAIVGGPAGPAMA